MGVPARTFTQAYYHLYGHNASPFLSKTVIFSGIFCIPFPGMAKGLAPRRKALIFLGTSLPLPQLRHEHDLPRLRAFGPDEAVVSLGNAPGDGEPYTEAAVGGAGLIRPIEAVKELLRLPLGQRCTGIAAPLDDAPFSLLQHKPDGCLRQGILHGVIQQDRHQLPHGVPVAAVGKPRHDSKLQRMALRPGKIPEGLRRLLHRLADGEVRQLQRRFLLVHAGERHRGPAEAEKA